jgi:hypothetical protein
MRMLMRLASGAALVALAACAPLPPMGAVFVRVGPPPYQEEVVAVAPGPGYVWVRGYWEWGGAAYYWVPGRWVAPPYRGARGQAGRWRHHRQGWYWVPGRWH